LPAVKAMGVRTESRAVVQVSMNLTDYRRTSLPQAFRAVVRHAAEHGVTVLDSEIVGLVPAAALEGIDLREIRLRDFSTDRTLEGRLHALGS
jgi:glutamate formiminotransferase